MDPKQFTPEQVLAMKRANAHGFITHLVTTGRLKRNEDGSLAKSASGDTETEPVTAEQAAGFYNSGIKLQEAIQKQATQVVATIREQIKGAGAAVPAAA